jgi:hypothetical protein
MSANEEMNNSKDNFIKMKAPLYFSPYSNKKHNFGNLNTEPRNIHQEIDSNLSKNQIKQKVNNANKSKNIINIQQQETFRNNTKLLSELTDKANQNKRNPQSYKKANSKLYLKKNVIPNISALNDTNSGNNLSKQNNTNSNTNINNTNNEQNKYLKNRLTNIKFNIGKSSQNFLNSKNSSSNLKKNAGSACELLDNNNYLKKTKTKGKNIVEINNLNPIGYLYTAGNNQKSFLSPQNHGSNPKIIFFKNEKSKYFDENTSKDSKINQNQGNEQSTNDGENKKNHINCLLRNTFTNVKIYPTTILNNKIIYNQVEKNNQTRNNTNNKENKNNRSENSNNNSSMHYNNSKIKKEKIVIETVDKKPSINNNKNNENFESIEELHYFYVNTLQRGRKYAIKLDK